MQRLNPSNRPASELRALLYSCPTPPANAHSPSRSRRSSAPPASKSLWAGGCVRDQLLGLAPKDYDVATSATPDQIRDLFGRRRTLPIGAAFGVITVLGPRAAGQIEVATFRTDAAYSDGRHPDSVTFTNAEHDAQRRDFTINGLFFDPVAEQVVDYVGGQQDLEAPHPSAPSATRACGLAKTSSACSAPFASPPRSTSRSSPRHARAIQEMAADINTVSAERIGMEIRRMLLDPNRATALELLRDTNLLPHVLPEVATLPKQTISLKPCASLSTLDQSHSTRLALRRTCSLLASSLLAPSASAAASATPTKKIDRAAWLLANLPIIGDAASFLGRNCSACSRTTAPPNSSPCTKPIAGRDDPALAFCRERLAWPPERLNPPPLVDGADLIRHGLKPGPQFSALLEQIRDAQLNGEITTRDEALALADRLRQGPDTLP